MTISEISIDGGCGFLANAPKRSLVYRALDLLYEWHVRTEERNELRGLPDEVLKDIGISAEDAYREYRKPFWRP